MNGEFQMKFDNDHDLLIALLTDFNKTVQGINESMRANRDDFKDIRDNLLDGQRDLDGRLKILEKSIEEADLPKLKETVSADHQWIHDFTTFKHLAWVIASTFFIVIGYLLSRIIPAIHLFK